MHSTIEGVLVRPLERLDDDRGTLTEVFRDEWTIPIQPTQWNIVQSEPGVVRGVHCHVIHTDYLTVVAGELILGLFDARAGSSTFGVSELHRIPALTDGIVVPVGVAHGFCFEVPTTMAYGVSHVWNLADELGCRWDDPDLHIEWPCTDPVLSERDRTAGSLREMIDVVTSRVAPTDS